MKANPSLSILIITCDAYSDAWPPFYHFFSKNWSDCPYTIYQLNEKIVSPFPKAKSILTGPGKTWSQMLLEALDKIEEKYVMVLLEDYFLLKPVQNSRIERILDIMEARNASMFRLFPCPGPDKYLKDDYGLIYKDHRVSASLQAAIWNKKDLAAITNPQENPWEFEKYASQRSSHLKGEFLSVIDPGNLKELEKGDFPVTYLCTAIIQRKWTKNAIELMRREGLTLTDNSRKKETLFNYMYRNSSPFIQRIYYFISIHLFSKRPWPH